MDGCASHALFVVCAALLMMCVSTQLTGSTARCEGSGQIHVPYISDDPCITCHCKEGEIRCTREMCPPLLGCHVIKFSQSNDTCCKTCQGCMYEGKLYASGSRWQDKNKPCKQHECLAGVLTTSMKQCHSLCSNAQYVDGECCPRCAGCQGETVSYAEGESFASAVDACATCTCKDAHIVCEKAACPVLNCPARYVAHPLGHCCPECRGSREIYLPGSGACVFQAGIMQPSSSRTDNAITSEAQDTSSASSASMSFPDLCTKCVCKMGTMLCERQVCPALSCPPDHVTSDDKHCCPRCQKPKRHCRYQRKTYKHGFKWRPDLCTACSCNNGQTRCMVEECANRITQCPPNTRLRIKEGQCCPKCVDDGAVCTVFGDPHYRTFDGFIYDSQGACSYTLAEDCAQGFFSVVVHNRARASTHFAWTKAVTVTIGGDKIKLMQNLRVKVNGQKVQLPFDATTFLVFVLGQSAIMQTTFGVKVVWDGDSYLEVFVPPGFKNRMCGLCGNYNNRQSDELIGRDGQLYFHGDDFADTWRVGGTRTCHVRAGGGGGPSEGGEGTDPCTIDQEKRQRAEAECGVMSGPQFAACHNVVDMQPYLKSCVMDMCECPSTRKLCSCESLRAYMKACQREDIILPGSLLQRCQANKCPKNAVWKECACRLSCDQVQPIRSHRRKSRWKVAAKSCAADSQARCTPGCECKQGFVFRGSHCVKLRKCPHIATFHNLLPQFPISDFKL